MIRRFAALPIPGDIGLALARRQTGLEGARWRPLDALHVTLRFFGEIREDVARDLDAELSAVRGPPFEIALSGVGAFGDGPDIHAIWAGVAESEPLRRLARACASRASASIPASSAASRPTTGWRPSIHCPKPPGEQNIDNLGFLCALPLFLRSCFVLMG